MSETIEQTYPEKLLVLRRDFRNSVTKAMPYLGDFANAVGIDVKMQDKKRSFPEGDNGCFKVSFHSPDKLMLSNIGRFLVTVQSPDSTFKYVLNNVLWTGYPDIPHHHSNFSQVVGDMISEVSKSLNDEQLAKAKAFIRQNPLDRVLANNG